MIKSSMEKLAESAARRIRKVHTAQVGSGEELIELSHWAEKSELRLMLPVELLRMQGGYTYGPEHPFVRALRLGQSSLVDFYIRVRPKNICDFYNLKATGRVGESLPPWEIPWLGSANRTPPPGERGLSEDHGISFYGPATNAKIELEMKRLTHLRKTIEKNGYHPNLHGDISGYIVMDKIAATFLVRGGKHRAAVLASLGNSHIPVCFKKRFPRLVSSENADFWPLVKRGMIDRELAIQILRAYTRSHRNNQEAPYRSAN